MKLCKNVEKLVDSRQGLLKMNVALEIKLEGLCSVSGTAPVELPESLNTSHSPLYIVLR